MIINHNLNAMNAHRNMSSKTIAQNKLMEKLSSGLRIVRASDDAAGLAISEKMRSQILGLTQASRNSQDGISMIQTAEGALSETHAITQRMREIAIQCSNGTYADEDRELINQEFEQLKSEIDKIAVNTEFNGNKVLNGSLSGEDFIAPTSVDSLSGINNNKDPDKKLSLAIPITDLVKFPKMGEGDFEIHYKVSENKNSNSKNATIDLIDKSYFNGYKPYVLDSVTIKDVDFTKNKEPIILGDVNINISLRSFKDDADGTKGKVSFSNVLNNKKDGIHLHVGANKDQTIGFSINNMRVRNLGLGGMEVSTFEDSQEALERIDIAISKISTQRGELGSVQNRLEHAISSTDNTAENLQASESRIRDVDMAKEMMNLTKLNILQQASQSMIVQANQAPNQVLSILN